MYAIDLENNNGAVNFYITANVCIERFRSSEQAIPHYFHICHRVNKIMHKNFTLIKNAQSFLPSCMY